MAGAEAAGVSARADTILGITRSLANPAYRRLEAFEPWLTAQDRQGWRAHVTVQNKVAPETARALHTDLQAAFVPFRFPAPGVLLWRYRGGPWEPLAALLFGKSV